MHIYNVKAALRDTFYGEQSVLYGTRRQDARALASLSGGVIRLRATNGHRYWYFFVKDVKNRDLIRFLMRRNGLRPEFHMSAYYAEETPSFRVRLSELEMSQDLNDFSRLVSNAYSDDDKLVSEMAPYIDTINQKLGDQKRKMK
ncbi:MAG: hypothetical protein IKB05_03610 [Alphaproteobacteria bacterium]|nr:hypothetical protein [Alphaproteobacteria bacterium]